MLRPPTHLEDYVTFALFLGDGEPTSFKEAISCPKKENWPQAMSEEKASLDKNYTLDLVDLLMGKHAIGYKWVFKKKLPSSNVGQPQYKARLVAKGFAQKEGVGFNEIFSHVVKHTSIQLVLAIVVHEDMELEQLDV